MTSTYSYTCTSVNHSSEGKGEGAHLIRQTQSSEYLQARRRDTTLVRTRVLEHDHAPLLEVHPRLMGEEQVGTFDDVLVLRLALRIEQPSHIRDRDGLGAPTAWHKD